MKSVATRARSRGVAATVVAAAGGALTLAYGASTTYIEVQTTSGDGRVVPALANGLAVVLMALGVACVSRSVARGDRDG